MKKKIYLTISILIIILIFFNYQKFIKSEKDVKENKIKNESSITENSNNIIKNLKYSVNFENNTS